VSATTRGTLINCQVDRPSFVTRAQEALRSVAATLRLWRARHRERHSFTLLDERDLRDLRLSRWDVERELSKPFWKG
jgi:uncharacterized protein YjiS (DUF1127 family)